MDVNATIYGTPETWTPAQYLTFAKYANFDTAENPKNTLIDGNNMGKTPTGELVENSICTQALGAESLYSNVVWVHEYSEGQQYVVDEKPQVPYFFAECVSTDNNVQNNESRINPNYNYNSWSPYITDNTFQNKSAYSKPIIEYQPKKIIYRVFMKVCDANGNERPDPILLDRADLPAEQEVLTQYPYIANAYMRVYVDSSDTDTPQRASINSNSLFGVCPNVSFNADTTDINIDYAFFRSMQYNHIPIYGCFGITNYFDDYYTACLCDPADIVIDSNNVSARHLWDNDFKEFLIKQAACFGGFVYISGDSGISILEIPLDDNDVICGILDADGVGHGDYTRGADNRTNPIWDWQTNRDSPFNPYKVPDPNTYSNTTTFNTIGGLSTMFKRYVLNGAGVSALGGDLFKIGDDVVVDQSGSYQDYQNIMLNDFLTNNPIDAIISLKKFPLRNIPHDATIENLRLGKVQISTAGYTMPYNSFMYLFKPVDIFPRFGNCFLDYAPYTSIQLYIPFCGTIDLNPDDVMGKRVDVQLLIDFTTGNCDAFISVGNLVIKTASGQCAIDIPVTGTESATVDSQITNGIIQGKNARAKATTDFATANFTPAGLAQSIINPFSAAQNRFENQTTRAQTEYNVTHTQTPLRTIGTCTPVGGWAIDFTCRLIITYPTGAVIDNNVPPRFNDSELQKYGHLIGFATVDSATMNKYAGGLVVADSINLDGVSATDAEKELIIAAVKEGCYI